jgi:hypothetical protein
MGSGSGRKIRYARPLVAALDLDRVPRPLDMLLAHLSGRAPSYPRSTSTPLLIDLAGTAMTSISSVWITFGRSQNLPRRVPERGLSLSQSRRSGFGSPSPRERRLAEQINAGPQSRDQLSEQRVLVEPPVDGVHAPRRRRDVQRY